MTLPAEHQKLSLFSIGGVLFRSVRELVMLVAIVGLLASNVATVTSTLVHDAIYGAVSTVASIASAAMAKRVLASSPTARQTRAVETATNDLRSQRAIQDAKLQRLDADHRQLQAKHTDLGKQHKLAVDAKNAHIGRTKQMASSIRARLAWSVARGVETLPAKVIPAVGIAVSVGLTTWDIYDACATIEDINKVLVGAEQSPEDVSSICGVKTPTVSQVLASVRSGWRASVDKTKTEFAGMQGKVQLPEIRVPTKTEVLQVACPVVSIPGVCT